MPSDKRSFPPVIEESAERLRAAFQRELRKQRHRRGEIEAAVERSSGFFYKYTRGRSSMPIDLLLHALHEMGLDAGRFFANALGAAASSEALLEDLESLGKVDARLRRLEAAMRRLETAEAGPALERQGDVETLLADVLACKGVEQRRRMGNAERYRFADFADAYLEHLDAWRYDQPKEAAQCAAAVAAKLIPRLGGSQAERVALMAKAIGVFGSAHRAMGGIATAARAARVALELARRHGLRETTAKVLQRGAWVLSDNGQYDQALQLLNEACLLYVDIDHQAGIGLALVDRGLIRYYMGDYELAIKGLKRGLATYENESGPVLDRSRLSAFHLLAAAYHRLDKLDRAEAAYAQAVEAFKDAGESNWAKLVWLQGTIALERESYARAEELFRRALAVLNQTDNPDGAILCLDLTKVLFAQNKVAEAVDLALTMGRHLTTFSASKVITAAISGLMQAALAGQVSLQQIEEVQELVRSHQSRNPAIGLGDD